MNLPCRTLAGETELARPGDALSRRQRSLLRLVDGQRTLGEVLSAAHTLGLPTDVFFDLMQRGLVAMQAIEALAVYDAVPLIKARRDPWPPVKAQAQAQAQAQAPAWRTPGGWGSAPVQRHAGSAPDARMRAAAVQPYSGAAVQPLRAAQARPQGGLPIVAPADPAFDEARRLIGMVLRLAAPLRSAFTRWRVHRARDRRALRALMPSVRRRLASQSSLAQLWPLMRRVELLMMPPCIPRPAGTWV